MKVKIEYTVEVEDDFRRAINAHYGKPGLASRDEVKRWFREYGDSENDNLMHDLEQREKLDRGELYEIDPDDRLESVLLTGRRDDG